MLGPDVSEASRDMMVEEGYSVYVEGTATNGDGTKTFAWGFDKPTRYTACRVRKTASSVKGWS